MMRRSRQFAAAVAVLAAGSLGLAACGSGSTPSGSKAPTKLEIYSWWTGPGESAGLLAMIKDFQRKNPGVQVINEAVAGGAGQNAKPQLRNRIAAHNPPDSFQWHAGAETTDFAKQGVLQPLDSFYQQNGLNSVYPKQLLKEITYQGHIYSVPVNIHRANLLWYNPKLLKAAGVATPITSMKAWIAAMAKVKTTGKIPLCFNQSDGFGGEHLLENVLLSDLGGSAYSTLWPKGGNWNSAAVTKALNDYNTITKTYANSDYAALTWQNCAKEVTDGKAAMFIMGDWTYSYYHEPASMGDLGLPDSAYAYQATPGTDGTYQWLSDSFTLPVGAPHQAAAVKWLQEVSSKRGQDLFNPLKGSVPARTDADPSLYKGYLAWDLKQWHTDQIVGSATHNVVAGDAYDTAIQNAISDFLSTHDVSKFQAALAAANQSYGT
jgi:glucose/mannose transport system substrate-binding protein